MLGPALFTVPLLLAVGADGVPERLVLRIEHDDRLHSRLLFASGVTTVPLGDFRPSDFVVVGGAPMTDFPKEDIKRTDTRDALGLGVRTVVRGANHRLRQELTVTTYDAFPELALVQARYTAIGDAPVKIDRWVSRRFLPAAPGAPAPPFWSYQSGSYEKRPDWVLPLKPGFRQANFMGMNASDYGGGTPVSVVWRRDVAVGVGHLERLPKLVSLPVAMPDRTGATVGIEEDVNAVLAPGQSLTTLRSFVSVHRGDHFTALAQYRRLMIAGGTRFPEVPASAHDPIWCGWGYGRDVTREQISGTLPKAAELGFKWAVLDDGWQTAEGDWKLHPDKFPGGVADMKQLTGEMKKAGLRPMLWWAPLAADPGTDVLKEHPHWLLLGKDGKPRKISWWNSYYLCPAFPAVLDYSAALVTRFIAEWGYDGLKLDGQHLNAVPPCYNREHDHTTPAEPFEKLPQFWQHVQQAARRAKPQAVLELCPCGTAYAFHSMPFFGIPAASDPGNSWQVRLKGKTLKALMGPSAPYFGDHVELSDGGDDFASTVGVGGVVGTQFTVPGLGRQKPAEARKYQLTPAKEEHWKKWVGIHTTRQLSRGEYLGALYDIGFDRPEAHAIKKEEHLYYAFFAPRFGGKVELRGLDPERAYCVRDYVNDQSHGQVQGPRAELPVTFSKHLLLEAVPRAPSDPACK